MGLFTGVIKPKQARGRELGTRGSQKRPGKRTEPIWYMEQKPETAPAEPCFAHSLESLELGVLDASPRMWYRLRNKSRPGVEPADQSNSDDVLIRFRGVRLFGVRCGSDGYYAVIGMNHTQTRTVKTLVTTLYGIACGLANTGPLKLVSPLEHADEGESGARLLCKISIFAGRSTSIVTSTDGEQPNVGTWRGVSELCSQLQEGMCDATLELAGFWHDQASLGPLIYLRHCRVWRASPTATTLERLTEPHGSPGPSASTRSSATTTSGSDLDEDDEGGSHNFAGSQACGWENSPLKRAKLGRLPIVLPGDRAAAFHPNPMVRHFLAQHGPLT